VLFGKLNKGGTVKVSVETDGDGKERLKLDAIADEVINPKPPKRKKSMEAVGASGLDEEDLDEDEDFDEDDDLDEAEAGASGDDPDGDGGNRGPRGGGGSLIPKVRLPD
jgi:ATP-dependent Clp protease ATP-binding subunit ClpA